MEPGIIVRPWLFLLLKEGCGRTSNKLEHPQAYTFANLLSWHRHMTGGTSVYLFRSHLKDLSPIATYLLQIVSHNFPVAMVRQGIVNRSGNRTQDLSHDKRVHHHWASPPPTQGKWATLIFIFHQECTTFPILETAIVHINIRLQRGVPETVGPS